MVATSLSFVNFDKMNNIGRKSSSTIIAFDTVPSIPDSTIDETSTISSKTIDQACSKEEVPVEPCDHHARLIPFMFPTLGDLPGLLVSSTVGAIFQNAQVEQLRNRCMPVHVHHHPICPAKPVQSSHERGDEELQLDDDEETKVIIETWSAFARRVEHDPNTSSSMVTIPPDAKHIVRIPIVTPSGQAIGEEEVEVPDHISETQIVPSQIDAILHKHGSHSAVSGDVLTKGMWVDNTRSKESVESVDAARESYFRRIYVTLGLLSIVAVAYIGVASVMFYKHFFN